MRSCRECLNPSLWQRSLHELSSNSLFFICSSASLPLCILFPAYFASLCLSYAAGSWAGMLHGDTELCWWIQNIRKNTCCLNLLLLRAETKSFTQAACLGTVSKVLHDVGDGPGPPHFLFHNIPDQVVGTKLEQTGFRTASVFSVRKSAKSGSC